MYSTFKTEDKSHTESSKEQMHNNDYWDEFNKLYKKFETHDWEKWLEYKLTLKKPGKQGLVGIMNIKEETKRECIFKISQYINDLTTQEYIVMKDLLKIKKYCPHFCRPIGLIKAKTNPKMRKVGNPFNIKKTSHPINNDVLLMEKINNSSKLYNYIRNLEVDDNLIYSAIKQIIMALVFSRKVKFTHYDLHSFNVMMRKCDKDLVLLYSLNSESQFCVPTFGRIPVIIDFGFSFSESINNNPLFCSLSHTTVGFISDRYDWVSDLKLFLVSVSSEIEEKRKRSRRSKVLRRIVKNIFFPLKLDWDCGWDLNKKGEISASDLVTDILEEYQDLVPETSILQKYPHYCIDILQSIIILL